MNRFNLSEWALRNRALVFFFTLLVGLIGAWSYARLGQSEDPPFTFKVMVIRTMWPGATAQDVSRQITERIETKLQETGTAEFIRSYSRPGESMVMYVVDDAIGSDRIPDVWYQVRKKVGDIRHTLPQGIVGPFYNDEFGDTFGNIYALSGDGFSYAELKDYAKRVQLELLRVPDVAKVELVGLQDEKIHIELSNAKLATLGVAFDEVLRALEAQNAVVPAGAFETATDRIYLRASGPFDSVESIREMPIRAGERLFRLGEVADVTRGYADPAQPRMRFNGEDVLGVAVSMAPGGDIVRLGRALDAETARIADALPVGLELHRVADQPLAVRRSIDEFVASLAEAVVIVLIVSFVSLGLRTGLVVALSIPLVLAATFGAMHFFDIGLHKISLGALILALGLLVDDAIIAVEMMAVKLEQGFDRVRAAAFAYESTAFPMLTGTLVTAAGFLPIATAASSTGEYTRSIFQVVVIALLISWIAAVVLIPYLGYKLLPERPGALPRSGEDVVREASAPIEPSPSGLEPLPRKQDRSDPGPEHGHDPYATRFYLRFRSLVEWCVERRGLVVAITIAAFLASIALFRFVPQQFFPNSTRLELMVDLKLPEGASLDATSQTARKLEAALEDDDDVESLVAYVGSGSPRFYLPLDQQLPQASFAQFVVTTRDIEARERVRARLIERFETDFHDVRARVVRLENGPPVGYPVQFRVAGEDVPTVRALAREVAAVLRRHSELSNVNLDWEEPSKIIRLDIDQERARVLGVSSQDLANFLQSSISGQTVSHYREGDELIEMVLRGPEEERAQLELIGSLAVPTASGRSIPLAQIATVAYGFEDGIIWRRDRLPTVTVRADIYGGRQPASLVAELLPELAPIRAKLPSGYLLETGGAVEESAQGQASVNAGVPLFLLVVLSVLMLQLRSLSRTLLVVATAPLGLIGVVLFMLVFRQPFGFVAMLGTIALSGMIMRNSVILVDQIDQDIRAGHTPFQAIVDATVRRFRPIVLTAAAAILAMIPLSRSAFFGPMAVAIMGGLLVATALTVLFLPALYALWFRIRRPAEAPAPAIDLEAAPAS